MSKQSVRIFTKFHIARNQIKSLEPHVRLLYVCNVLSMVGGTVYGLYYGIFLYRQSFSLSILAVDGLLCGVGSWLGYGFGVAIIRRLGYQTGLRLAFGLWAAVSIFTACNTQHIAAWFMVLAIVRSLPGGIYGATCDTMLLREVGHAKRESFFQLVLVFEFLATIVLPSAVGALIHVSHGYQQAFWLAGIIYAVMLLVPMRLAKPSLQLHLKELPALFSRPGYRLQAVNKTLAACFNQLNAFVSLIIPFILLKDELKVGLATSAAAIMAAAVSLGMRRVKTHRKLRLAYQAYGVRAACSLLFVCFWTAPFLFVWQIVTKLLTPVHDPVQQAIEIQNDSRIMGQDLLVKALQINIMNNGLSFVGTVLAYGGFYLLTRTAFGQQRSVMQLLVLVYAAWRFVNLALSRYVNMRTSGVALHILQRRPSYADLLQWWLRSCWQRSLALMLRVSPLRA